MITDPKRDPFGQAMLDYYRGNLQAEVQVYSNIAVDDIIPVSYLFRTRSQMPTWEIEALERCQGAILDIGAGAGCHSLELQTEGKDVTAMDISPGAIQLMGLRGVTKRTHCGIMEYSDSQYDTLLLLMNGIGVVGDLKGLNAFLNHARLLLKPGGQILLDSSDLSYLFAENSEELIIESEEQGFRGVIRYQMMYRDTLGDPFNWLYLDFPRLERHARMFGYDCEQVSQGSHHEYLARLKVSAKAETHEG